MNFLTETKTELERYNKTPKDIKWIGSDYGWITWGEFEKIADFDYDNGYGAAEIAEDLVIVGEDWWLERYEYDGSEEWNFKTIPQKPKTNKPITKLGGKDVMWENLEKINKPPKTN